MRGEWFDTVSNCVTFSISAKKKKPAQVSKFRHTIVRLMSLAHGSALEEIAGNQVQLDTIDVFGLDSGTLRHLKICHEKYHFNKVEVMLHLVQSLITDAFEQQVLNIPPPILSRVYQTISRGFVNLLNAKKITDTRFPFPYAQLITFLLFALTVLTPLIMSCVVKSKVLLAVIVFVPVFAMYSLNFIAIELENPFGVDTNDLPLEVFQSEMNNCLLMLLHTNTDLIASTSADCMMDFDSLYKEISGEGDDEGDVRADGSTGPREQASRHVSRRKTRLSHFKDITLEDEGEEFRPKSTVSMGEVTPETTGPPPTPPAKTSEAPTTPLTGAPPPSTAADGKKAVELPPVAPVTPADVVLTPNPTGKAVVSLDQQPPGGAQADAKSASDLQPILAKSMSDFNRTMQHWTKMIESQVLELDRNCIALQNFNDSLTAGGGKAGTAGASWEGALPGV